MSVTTRRQLLLLLRKHPGVTVAELAGYLKLTGMAVRRHLDTLAAEGLAVAAPVERKSVGRPPAGWSLSPSGQELFPRRYDSLALDVLEDLEENAGAAAVEDVFRHRTEKLVSEYTKALDGVTEVEERVGLVARLRDDAGYLAEWAHAEDGQMVLTENNCAVHRVAQRYPVVCTMEMELIQRVLGPDVEVSRESHTMAGDPVCSYRVSCGKPPRS